MNQAATTLTRTGCRDSMNALFGQEAKCQMRESAKSSNPRPQGQGFAIWLGLRTRVQFRVPPSRDKWPKRWTLGQNRGHLFGLRSGSELFSVQFQASSCHRGTRDGGAGSGSVSGGRGALGSGGRPTVLWFCSHSQRACSEKRTLPTKARCGTCFLARYSGVVNQCLGSPVASITSWAVT